MCRDNGVRKRLLWFALSSIAVFSMSCSSKSDQMAEKLKWDIVGKVPADASGNASIGVAGPVVGIHNEVMLLAGGANFPEAPPWEGGKKAIYREGSALKRTRNGQWKASGSFALERPVAYAASCSMPTGVVFAGGEDESGPLRAVWRLKWDAAARKVVQESLPELPVALSNAAMANLGDKLYVAGGQSADEVSARFMVLDPGNTAKGWQALPDLPRAVSHAVLLAQSNGTYPCLYLIGGRKANPGSTSDLYDSVFCYDPKKNTWAPVSTLPRALSAGTGVAAGPSYLLLFSGDAGEVFSRSEQLLADIQKEQDTLKKEALKVQRAELLRAHPGFRKEVLLFNTVTNTWTTIDSIPYPGQVTTQALRRGDEILIPSGEIKAGVRTPDIVRASIVRHKSFFVLDYIVLVAYLLLMVFIGLWSSSQQGSTNDYFKGGQRIPGWAAGLSIYGTQLSAITFMSIPAKTYATNWNYFFLQMTVVMSMPIIVRYFIPFFRRLNITSAYEYLEKRFSYTLRAAASLLFIFLQLGRLAIVLLLPSLALTLVTGIDVVFCILIMGSITIVYTMYGGIEAVIWTDVVQVFILLGGALLAIGLISTQLVDSPALVWQTLTEGQKINIFDVRLTLSEPTLWVVLIGGMAINVISYGTDQTVVQRYLTTKDESSARKSLQLGAWMTLPSALIFFSIGTLLFLFYRQFPEKVDIGQQSMDAIFPWYIVSQMPSGFIGFLISAIFAAAMSTLSSSINSITAAITIDFYRRFKTDKSESDYLRLARIITLIVGAGGTIFALIMSKSGISSLWDEFNTILGLFTGGLGGLFVLGIFTKKANAPGALIGLLLSGVVQYYISEYTQVNLLLYAFTGLTSCVLFGYLFSLAIPNGKKALDGLTYKTIAS